MTLSDREKKLRELREKLDRLKMPEGEWTTVQEKEVSAKPMERYLDALLTMRGVIEGQMSKEKDLLGKLIEAKNRLQRGGAVNGG